MSNERERSEALERNDPAALARARAELSGRLLIPHPGQEEILKSTARFRTLAAGRRFGKSVVAAHEVVKRSRPGQPKQMIWVVANAQPLDEPVLTPTGWQTMGDLQVGDDVIGSDGSPTKVTGVYPHDDKDLWEVELSDGVVVRCADDHLWEVDERFSHNAPIRRKVYKTKELLDRGVWFIGARRFSINNVGMTCGAETPSIDGYLLGALLGDGHIPKTGTIRFANTDADIVDRVKRAALGAGCGWSTYRRGDGFSPDFGLTSGETVRDALREFGLLGSRSHTKFIPEEVLCAPPKYRLDVLRGLLDTDGGNASGGVQYTSVSEAMARGVADLARSLGGRATVIHNGRVWRTRVSMPKVCPFYCARKADAWKPVPRADKRQIVDVRKTNEKADMVCIEVAAEDHLYITTGYTKTHNTFKNTSRTYREIVRQMPPSWLAKPAPAYTSSTKILQLKNGTLVEFYSGGSPDAMAGEGVDFMVVDEAALIANSVWQQLLRATLMDTGGDALFISTPRGKNWFWEMYKLGQSSNPEYESWRFPQETNPFIDAAETQAAKEELPAIIFQQEIEAKFLAAGASIFGLGLERNGAIVDEIVEPRGNVFVGIDLAKKQDWTVITADREEDGMPCHFERFQDLDWPTQQKRIAFAIEELENMPGVESVTALIDSTGIGDVVYDNLTAAGIEATPVPFTNQSKEQMARLLAADLEQGRAHVLSDMCEEFESFEFSLTPSGRYQFEAASGHDDMVAAKMLAHYGRSQEGGANVEITAIDRMSEEHQREGILDQGKLHAPDSPADIMSRPEAWDGGFSAGGSGRGFFGA